MTIETEDVVAEMIAKLRQKELSGSRYVHGKQLMNRRNFDGDEAADLIQSLSERIDALERENAELRVDDSDEAVEARIRAHGAGSHQGWPRTSDGRSW